MNVSDLFFMIGGNGIPVLVAEEVNGFRELCKENESLEEALIEGNEIAMLNAFRSNFFYHNSELKKSKIIRKYNLIKS